MTRSAVAAFLFILLAVGLSVRVVALHAFEKDFLQDQGDARTIRIERINAHRGIIEDARGRPLAVSSPVVSIWANPSELLKSETKLPALANALDVDEDVFRTRMQEQSDRNFVYLRRKIPPHQADKILEIRSPGVFSEKEYQRFYPAGEVAAHIVGFTDIDDEGQEGVELAFNDWLQGTPGKKKVLKNLYGQIVKDIMPLEEAKEGRDLALSIDLRIQYMAYRALKSAIQRYDAQSGSIVILDVETGAILSMVNQPSFNPNNRKQLDMAAVRNRSVTDVFEPGSTMKPFTVAVALATGAYLPESVIDTNPGFIKVDGFTIRDPSNKGVLDLGEIIAQSSQVGITKLALSLDEYDVWQMFHEVGFGQVTGIGFRGEREGTLPNHRRWKPIERATFAYGYGLSVTPLQLAASYMTFATGGLHREVSLLARPTPQDVRILDEEVAVAVRSMLGKVVTAGTGSRAATDAYTTGGKTGTVRKIGKEGYQDTEHLAFFAGMAPLSDPKLVAVVLINQPKSSEVGGGSVAAPVFSRVMADALRLLNTAPDKYEDAA